MPEPCPASPLAMRSLPFMSPVLRQTKVLVARLLLGIGFMAAANGFATTSNLKLSESLAPPHEEAILQLLKDLATDQLSRDNNSPAPATAESTAVAEPEANPALTLAKDFGTKAPPPEPETQTTATVVPPPAPEKLATPASDTTVPPEAHTTTVVQQAAPVPPPEASLAPDISTTLSTSAVAAPLSKAEKPENKEANALVLAPAPVQASKTAAAPPASDAVSPPAAVAKSVAAAAAAHARDGLPPLGIGDQITIAVFGQPDLSAEVTVGESGTIMIPLIGTLNVLNMSAAQLETMVALRLKDGGYLQNPGVSVQIRQLRSQLVSVIGEVQRPGRYPIQGKMSVLEAIATAGGLTQRADKTVVLLRKPPPDKGVEVQREEIAIQLDSLTGQLGGRLDAPLLNDDVIFVGIQKLFYIHGEVRRPGAYPMESGMNVMKAISLSGGVSERGSERRIKIHRYNNQKILNELPAIPSTPVQADDVIHVDQRLF